MLLSLQIGFSSIISPPIMDFFSSLFQEKKALWSVQAMDSLNSFSPLNCGSLLLLQSNYWPLAYLTNSLLTCSLTFGGWSPQVDPWLCHILSRVFFFKSYLILSRTLYQTCFDSSFVFSKDKFQIFSPRLSSITNSDSLCLELKKRWHIYTPLKYIQ